MSAPSRQRESLIVYFLLGIYLGVIFIKSQVASWFRIQEMFRFQSIHMYGVIGVAVAVGATSVFLMKRAGTRDARGQPISFSCGDDRVGWQHILGGTAFGLGWGLLGACPGPIYALIGNGASVMIVALAAAVAGAWTHGRFRSKLPHGPIVRS